MTRRIYLDHAATTPVRPAVIDAIAETLRNDFGNPSGVHRESRRARTLLEDARDRVAAVFGANPHEVVFTGGGTEAINLALTGCSPKRLLWSAVEHDAVRSSAAAFERRSIETIELGVDATGAVRVDELSQIAQPGDIVAVMAVNNEVGTIEPIADVASRAHHAGALLVVDAVQALTWVDVRSMTAVADFVALSGHKFGAPKGVGALIIRGGRKIEPLLHGGGQEQERRSGTQNVAGIVGLAIAAEITDAERANENVRIAALRNAFVDTLVTTIPGCTETVSREAKVAGNAHVCITGIESEELLVLIDSKGVAASAGSACASGALHLSPVLEAMGVAREAARGAMRFTLGVTTTADDVRDAAVIVASAVTQLRNSTATLAHSTQSARGVA